MEKYFQPDQGIERGEESFPNIASFIEAKKEIVCPKEELDEATAEALKGAEGRLFQDDLGTCYLVDNNGNLCTFKPNYFEGVKSMRGKGISEDGKYNQETYKQAVLKELEDSGFKLSFGRTGIDNELYDIVFNTIQKYQKNKDSVKS